ncbi:MAG: 1-acyl-sn-glycerol-3-phosphate acyltransferase [Friedmanniella sp.]|nr:1-acyl-sn-glycerol-3-phosphate acyltransferase [Friedmanniella sp.]
MLYWVFKWVLFVPVVRAVFRPTIEGAENVPDAGPAILVSNHISAGDTFVLPAMIRRRVTFPAKAELFTSRSLGGRVVGWFLRNVGQLPMDRSGGRASATSMEGVLSVLRRGDLLGIYPEGTRSPDGRLHKGKTGVARLVLQAGVPVIPVGMIDSQFVPARLTRIPLMRRPKIRIGPPLDFSAYAGAGNDRTVLRWVTDEIMAAVMDLSGQTYVDAYASSVKDAAMAGREFPTTELARPGADRPVPTPPAPAPAEDGAR